MLGGVITAIATPFDAAGAIDYDAFQALCRHLVDNGSDGLVISGTTGRARPSRTVSASICCGPQSRRSATARRSSRTREPSRPRTRSSSPEQAHEAGADAFLAVTPYYNKPPQRGIVAHFRAIAAATDRPVVVYNIPSRVVVNIEPATMSLLAAIPNVRAVKQALPDPDEARHIVSIGLDLYAGDDALVLPFLELGGVGGICVHTHIVGPQVAAQVQAARDGDLERAREIDVELRAGLRSAHDHDEPDPDQGRPEPARARGRRLPPPARIADRR